MNGFPSTIKLSALRGTYSRVVARVSLKVNADLPRKKKKVHWDTRLYSCSSIIQDFIVRSCDCKMDFQNLYSPGSEVRRKCKRKGRSFVHAVFTMRLHCPSLHVWRANQCVNARALGLAFPFVLRKVCASLRFNFRCVCAEAGTNYWHYFTFNLHVSFIKKKATWSFFLFKYLKTWLWHPDMPTLLRWSWYFYTTDAIETWITEEI